MVKKQTANSSVMAVFDNDDLLREISRYFKPYLPVMFVFHNAREALKPHSINTNDKQINGENSFEEKKYFVRSYQSDFVNSVPMVKWAMKNGCDFRNNEQQFMNYIGKGGHLNVLEWALKQKPPFHCSPKIHEEASKFGHLHIIKYLLSRRKNNLVPIDIFLCLDLSAEHGRLDVMQWLRADWVKRTGKNFNYNDHLRVSAVRGRQKHIIEFLKPCPIRGITVDVINQAVKDKNLEMVQWLRAQDPPFPWDENTCLIAARVSSLEILQWLRSQDPPCPWEPVRCLVIAEGEEMRNWLIAQIFIEQGINAAVTAEIVELLNAQFLQS